VGGRAVRLVEVLSRAVPAVLRPLANAAPTTVPATPRNDAAIAAETAARALATTWVALSAGGRTFDESATEVLILVAPSRRARAVGASGAGPHDRFTCR
jgi:hypothetical protein